MFKFLKDKLKGVLSNFSREIEKEAGQEPAEAAPEKSKAEPIGKVQNELKEKDLPARGFFQRIKETFEGRRETDSGERKGLATVVKEALTTKRISKEKFHELFWDMEVMLLENNVAMEVIEKIKGDLESSLVDKPLPRAGVSQAISATLRKTIEGLFVAEKARFIEKARSKKPFIILFLGINGSGKTTTIAKMAKLLMNHKLKVALAASDTFRAASIEQLQHHADMLGVRLIRHDYGSDPAAVAFDAIKYAESKGIDAVLIDTAGRLHSNSNLMAEMGKIVRVSNPDLKLFIGESITGNDCVEQARSFNEAIGIDGIILSKADVDEKGGAAISVSHVTKKPILFIGTGQGYDDLVEFNPKLVIEGLGLEA
ncbi:signal recognition particle-docking protein FtsY [Candidatus Woesearchaeota archaeon]|nr:signal recognition particle-docking protein FtsY [Candidatus Woesearchaeota archaeon]